MQTKLLIGWLVKPTASAVGLVAWLAGWLVRLS